MSISAPFIARPIATCLLAVAVLLGGALGYAALPVSALPQVDFPTIVVTTDYPGAGPETMATLVTAPLERQLGEINGIVTMQSSSAVGTSAITLQFDLSRSMDGAAQDVQAAINAAQGVLPSSLPYPPAYNRVNPADAPVVSLAVTSPNLPADEVADAADTYLQPRLSQLPGVGRVVVQGGLKSAIRIRLDPARLAAYGLSMEDVRTAVSAANVNGAKGSFDGKSQAYEVDTNDQLLSPEAYRSLIVAWRAGAAVRLSDVGSVVHGVENTRVGAWYRGRPAVLLDIQRQPGANIVNTVALVRQALPDLQAAMPPGVHLELVADRTQTIRASVADVQGTLLLSMLLVVGVIFLFLGSVRATVIPAVALPLSLIGTFGIMSWLGYGLDNLSLMALTVASGFVVDDAIVMIENVVRFIEGGMRPMEAAYRGAAQIGFTIVSLTVSLIAVFIPLLFMGGVVGRLFNEFSVTLSVAVAVSAVVSLTLTPMMCGRLLRPRREGPPGRVARFFDRVLLAYRRSLAVSLRHQGLVLGLAVLTLGGTILLYVAIPKGFLPLQDTGAIIATTEAAPSISIPAMAALQLRAAAIVQADPAVTGVASPGWRRRRQSDAECRPPVDYAQTQAAAGRRAAGDGAAAAGACRHSRHGRVYAAGAGHPDRRTGEPDAVSVHADRYGRGGAWALGAGADQAAARRAGAAARDERPAAGWVRDAHCGGPGPGDASRRDHAVDRGRALRCFRAKADQHDLRPEQPVSGGDGG